MEFKLLAPHEAPSGISRALTVVTTCLADPRFDRARFAVAFARKAGVIRVAEALRQLRDRGGRAEVIVGIDHRGTSEEALRLLLESCDQVFVLHEPGSRVTFHPKMYLFDGATSASVLVGSHNLTCGGLELNYEAGIVLEFELPTDSSQWSQFEDMWSAIVSPDSPNTSVLSNELLGALTEVGLVQSERFLQAHTRSKRSETAVSEESGPPLPFSSTNIVPPSTIPPQTSSDILIEFQSDDLPTMTTAHVLLIEVVPKRNSEVFLSSKAIKQNPGFFGWPWSGLTVPKRSTNQPYPKMDPHPTIKIVSFDENGVITKTSVIQPEVVRYHNADVRMTVGQELVPHIPPFSLFVIRHPDEGVDPDIDYEIEVHPEESPGYRNWIGRCDQKLPAGGRPRARRMGWV